MIITGTLINTAAVITGSMIGLIMKTRFQRRLEQPLFNAIGAFTVFLGIRMAFESSNVLILVISMVLGTLTGELINIERWVNSFSSTLKDRFKINEWQFSKGLITGFLLFCMGSMTVLGAFEEGMGKTPQLFYAKSVLDGISSIVLASTLGIGVLFSALPLLLYQSALTLIVWRFGSGLSVPVVSEVTAAGGLMLVCLGISIMGLKEIKVINMLPALLIAGVLAAVIM